MMYGYDDGYGMFVVWGFIIHIILIGIIVFVVYKLFASNHLQKNKNSAIDELNTKFVNGELTEKEYLRKKELINKK